MIVTLALAVAAIAARPPSVTVVVDATSSVWDIITALGTLGATFVALWLAVSAWTHGRSASARLVSVWVTDDYQPLVHADHYLRQVTLHVANESDEPAFDVHVSVTVGATAVPLGPLSAPSPIVVLPPRRELCFDLSTPLLAHDDTWNPRAAVTFRDRSGRRWTRDPDGMLTRASTRARWVEAPEKSLEPQIGSMTPNNPMAVALGFLSVLRSSDSPDPGDLEFFLAPEAPGWADVDWAELRASTEEFQPTSMVDYPAPYIARVKLSGDVRLQGKALLADGQVELHGPRMFLTLTYAPDRGWRVFGLGSSVRPDQILFPSGTFRPPETRPAGE